MGLYYIGISRDYYRYILLYRGYNYREYIPLFPTNHQQEKHQQTERSLIFALPHQIYQAVTKLDSSSWLAQGLRAIPYIPNMSQQHSLRAGTSAKGIHELEEPSYELEGTQPILSESTTCSLCVTTTQTSRSANTWKLEKLSCPDLSQVTDSSR